MEATTHDRPDTSDMLMIHAVFRGELAAAPSRVRGVARGDVEQAERVADHYAYILSLLHSHHEGEDELLWPKLNARCELQRELVARMEAQHQEIARHLTASEAELERWRRSARPEDGEPLLQSLDGLGAVLQLHLGEEEEKILPLAADHLTVAEWAELGQHGIAEVPQRWMPVTLGLCLRNLPPAARTQFLSQAPEGIPQLWASGGEAAFEAHMAALGGGA